MATIRDVAKLSGVSIASVSRIINNDPTYKVLDETRSKVLKACERLNYEIPESYKKKKKKLSRIGCIQSMTPNKTVDSYYAAISRGIIDALDRHNYKLDFMRNQFDIENLDDLSSLLEKPCDGLIIMSQFSDEQMKIIRSKVKHIVGIDTVDNSIDNVRYNRFGAGIQAMQYLIDNGHKKIAYIGSKIPRKDNLQYGRFEAYSKLMKINDYEIDENWIIDCEWDRNICYEKTIELMKKQNRPTAIFVGSDHMAIACISAINSLGLRIPEDISVVGISDIEASKYLTPPLTTVAIPQKEIGEIAAEDLLSLINGNSTVVKEIFVPTKLIIRKSVCKCRQ